jgi:Cys-rich repeat protein
MKPTTCALLLALCASPLFIACGAGQADASAEDSLTSDKKHHCASNSDCKNGQICQSGVCQNPPSGCQSDADCSGGQVCTNGTCQNPPGGGPAANPPPASCDQRSPGVTAIQSVVKVTRYAGMQHGHNGDHEIVYGVITDRVWVYDAALVDGSPVQVAMNVASSIDPSGLPKEIPIAVGQTFEIEGEYIPASTANASGNAVIHYTHSPCGYALIGGTKYQ